MRLIITTLVLALGACGSEDQSEEQTSAPPPAAAVATSTAAAAVSGESAMMAIPDDPEALKRLEAMGYTIHKEEGHLHAPGVTSCPAMGDGPTM